MNGSSALGAAEEGGERFERRPAAFRPPRTYEEKEKSINLDRKIMSTHDVMTHAYEEKIDAQLQQAKAQLGEFEARAKSKKAQAEIEAINHLRTKHQEIEKKVQKDFKIAGEVAVAAKVKTDIDSEMTKFRSSLDQLSAKIKSQSAA